jgi:sucrose-6-phosphate hydrolase SacC (GH32 family)
MSPSRANQSSLSTTLCRLMAGVLIGVQWAGADELWPADLTRFSLQEGRPVFTAGDEGDWDAAIRERGWILNDGDTWRMWYTGYDGTREGQKKLGLATSPDGIHWTRHPDNPIYTDHWVEDMQVVKHDGRFLMFAEGAGDRAHLLESPDGVSWTRIGPLDVRQTNGEPLSEGPYGTPTAYFEDGTWYLFYERRDAGIWLATSKDLRTFTNISDEPVLSPGPDEYDRLMIALNQVIKRGDRYYAFFHGSGTPEPPRLWCPAIATSTDLIHWEKYPGSPLIGCEQNVSSGIVVETGEGLRFYTMHGAVRLHTSD